MKSALSNPRPAASAANAVAAMPASNGKSMPPSAETAQAKRKGASLFKPQENSGATTTRAEDRTRIHSFSFHGERARHVCIAGSFNNWNPTSHPLFRKGNGTWKLDLPLPPGSYEYRLVVDGQWQEDPFAPASTQNPFGEKNSILRVG